MRSRTIIRILMCFVFGVLFAGCASTSMPVPRALGAQYTAVGQKGWQDSVMKTIEPSGELNLNQALAQALLKNPELIAFSYDVRIAEARILQAGAFPDPTIQFEVEEYDHRGNGMDDAEVSYALGQVIELGGKRHWRTKVAIAQGALAGWSYESKRLEVFSETARLFMAVITAEKTLELTESTVDLAANTFRAVQGRVEAGKEPPFQASKASAELELTKIEQVDAKNALELAKRRLAAMWGSETPRFSSVSGDIDKITPVPSLDILRGKLSQNPNLARWDDEVAMRKATLASEKAKLIPDLQGVVGVQTYEEDGSDALKFGVKVNLPLFSRARGGIVAAGSKLAKAEENRKAAKITLVTDLAAAYADLATSHSKVMALRKKVIPAMEESFNAAQEGYRQGKFNFMDVLDAQRSLYKTRNASLGALLAYHAAVAEIQRITGTSIEELNKIQKETK